MTPNADEIRPLPQEGRVASCRPGAVDALRESLDESLACRNVFGPEIGGLQTGRVTAASSNPLPHEDGR